ncbi:hypothetical protein ACLB2K_019158 [Fragaria x ananassa]
MGSFCRRNLTSSSMVFPILIILSSFAYCEVGKPSAYDVLQQYDFPIGILPIGVTGYELNTETGYFSIYLSGTCTFSVENSYQLEYNSTISGFLSKGRLSDLKGVSVKVFFFWLSIVEVVHVGNDLQFSVGIASANFPASNFDERPHSYEALEEYDFPVGILPKGVLSYEVGNSTGEFSVYLNGSCTFSIDSYELKYKSTITGVITNDKISSLSGIKVKVLFLWLSIVTVVRDEDEIEFSVGIASADFAVSNFVESPTCGCGFDCVNVNQRKIKFDDQSQLSSA